MRAWKIAPLLAVAVLASGCYTTVVDTGRAPSRHRVRDDWVWGFASGLVMVERVDAGRACSAGVARIRTEQSLANFAVQTLTAGLLSPRSVEVTCAAGSEDVFRWARGRALMRIRIQHERIQRDFDRDFRREFRREGRGRGWRR